MKSYKPIENSRLNYGMIRTWIRDLIDWANETEISYKCAYCEKLKYYAKLEHGDNYCHRCASMINWKNQEA